MFAKIRETLSQIGFETMYFEDCHNAFIQFSFKHKDKNKSGMLYKYLKENRFYIKPIINRYLMTEKMARKNELFLCLNAFLKGDGE